MSGTDETFVQIVRGDASAEDVAALTALLASSTKDSGGAAASVQPVRGRWNDPAAAMRRTARFGPGGWRAAR